MSTPPNSDTTGTALPNVATSAGQTSPESNISLTQFQQLMSAMLGAVQAANSTATPPTVPNPTVVTTKSINWSQMPKLDLARPGELDYWFLSLEGRLRAAQVPEAHWAEKVMECPGVEESVKMRIRQLPHMDYALIRQSILKEHGPIDPMGYFLRAIYRVKGTYREDVREQLTRLLTVYNRAASDEQRPGLTQRDLCYPFLESFPASVGRLLEQQLALVFVQDDPFEHLFRLSPARPPVEVTPINYTAPTSAVEPGDKGFSHTPSKRKTTEPTMAAALIALTETLGRMDARGPKQRRLNGDCRGCGGSCVNRAVDCPAYTRMCFNCNKIGHFANVCDCKPNLSQGTRRGFPQNSNRPFRSGENKPNPYFRSDANQTRPS